MASTYSPSLRTELPATGDQNNAWATTVDNNLSVPLEQGITNVAPIAMPDADYTLTTANAAADEARSPVLVFTGALTADRFVTAPSVPKIYIAKNNTTGGKNIVLRTGGGTASVTDKGYPVQPGAQPYSGDITTSMPVAGVSIPPNTTAVVICDGTNFDFAINSSGAVLAADSAVLTNPLAVTYGGTAATTAASARTNLGAGTASVLDASATSVSNSAVARDAFGNLDAGTITAGLSGVATLATNTLQLGGLPPPSYSLVDTNWSWQVNFPLGVGYPGVIDFLSLAGPGLYKFELNGTSSNRVEFFYAVPDGSTVNLAHQGIGQFFAVPQFFTVNNATKLGKDI